MDVLLAEVIAERADAGKISHDKALSKVEKEYCKYQVKTVSPVEKAYLDTLKTVQKQVEKETKGAK